VLTLIAVAMLAVAARADDDLIDADRPGIADGSHSVKRSHFQFENGVDVEHSGEERSWSVPTLLRYGLSDAFELRVESNTYEHTKSGSKWSPVSIGFKDHFYERDGTSLGVIGRWFFPTGDLRLAADVELGEHWSLNPNIGIEKPGGGIGALTVQYNLSKKANVFVDGGFQRSVLLDTGAAWIIGSNSQLDVSVGWGAHGAAPNFFWSAGLSERF
jgi:outer membrane putative beta-barrel porin/alpha-amylase